MRRAIDRRERALLVYVVVLLGFGLAISEVVAHSRLVKSDPPRARSLKRRRRS